MLHNFWLAKPHGLANQKVCYIQVFLKIEKSGEKDKEHLIEWSVNRDPDFFLYLDGFEGNVNYDWQNNTVFAH